jgi:hypothetical protein
MLPAKRPSSLQIVLGGCVFVSLLAGAWAFHMLQVSQKFITQSLVQVVSQGKTANMEECVDISMDWYESCEAMKSLCESSVARAMSACLSGQDRASECSSLGNVTKDTHFGFKECQERGVTRFTKKACAATYRAIDQHCERLTSAK